MEKKINFKYQKFLISCLVLVIFALSNNAMAWTLGDPNDPLVPCGQTNGTPCTQCELLHLVDNLMDFILIAAAPILATFFFIVAGLYIMLGGAKPDMLATGKRMFTSALTGMIIVMMAWFLTNVLITSLVDPNPLSPNYKFNSSKWWTITCDQLHLNTQAPGSGGPPPPPPPPPACGAADVVTISQEQANPLNSFTENILWFTDKMADSEVDCSIDSGNGCAGFQQCASDTTTLTTGHALTVGGLNPATTYCYQVVSRRVCNSGNGTYTARGSILRFTTLP